MNIVGGVLAMLGTAGCFGYLGHRIIGRMTWGLLEEDMRGRLQRLFGGKTVFLHWVSWPDRVKRSAEWRWTFAYHFVNSQDDPPHSCNLTLAKDDSRGNLLTALADFERAIAGSIGRPVENFAFLVHLLGDLHQPLHLTAKDHGGTRHYVQMPSGNGKPRRVPLHLLYDTLLLKRLLSEAGDDEEAFARDSLVAFLGGGEGASALSNDLGCAAGLADCFMAWARETNRLNCATVFCEETSLEEHAQLVRSQLVRAAVRTAMVLERLLRAHDSAS